MSILDIIPGIGGGNNDKVDDQVEQMMSGEDSEAEQKLENQQKTQEQLKRESSQQSSNQPSPQERQKSSQERQQNKRQQKSQEIEQTNNKEDQLEETEEEEEISDDSLKPNEEEHLGVPDIGRYHRDLIAPSGIRPERMYAKVGRDYTRTFFINGWSDQARDCFLENVFINTSVPADISIFMKQRDHERTMRELNRQVDKTRSRLEEGSKTFGGMADRKKAVEETEGMLKLLKEGHRLYDIGMYVTVRGDTEEELLENSEKMVKNLKVPPASTTPVTLSSRQLEGMRTVSPICHDEIGYKTPMPSSAVGAMFPFTSKAIVEENGVDFGIHAGNNSPVMVSRWDRDNGYNQFTVGKIGSGKSFSTKLNILRTYAQHDDVKIIMLDTLGGFNNITKLLGGQKVTVGGNLNFNPMEIKETPERILEDAEDLDPFAMKLKSLGDFFEMYFSKRGVNLGEAKSVLDRAVALTYEQAGISREIETHSNDSPTILDLMDNLRDMTNNPEDHVDIKSEDHIKRVEEYASNVLLGLEQFKEGQELHNLAQPTEIDIEQEDLVYFDLSQLQGTGDVGLMMHLLLNKVYNVSKRTEDKVLFAIDEAHYLMEDAESLEFLELTVRHSRHMDLGINFITQTIEEFFEHERSRKIVQNCDIHLFHRVETGLDVVQDALELNDTEINYIKNAQPGSQEAGYSEALLGVGNLGYIPMRVRASGMEQTMIDYDPDDLVEEV